MPAKIPTDELIHELQRFAEEIGSTPTQRQMEDMGEYSARTYGNRFGTWSNALLEAGVGVNEIHRVTKEELLDEIRRLHDELGRTPKGVDIEDYSKYAAKSYYRKFGSWNDALREVGLELNMPSHIPDSELLDELERLSDELGHSPSKTEMDGLGKFSQTVYQDRFGSWSDALGKVGLEPRSRSDYLPSGPEHPYWSGGITVYYGPNWEQRRSETLERDGYSCQSCGVHQSDVGSELCVHHITPLSEFDLDSDDCYDEANDLSNLVTLCRACHVRLEGEFVDCTASEFKERVQPSCR